MIFAAPWFLLGLLLLPVVVALHFVRQTRQERPVSAAWLWPHEQISTQHARFSATWLLLLQLLTVALASLAAAQPQARASGQQTVLILEASAAMLANDVAPNRGEVAKRRALEVLQNAGEVVLLRAGLSTTVLLGPTTNHAALRQALAQLQFGDAESDLQSAVALGQNLLPKAKQVLVSGQDPPRNFRGLWRSVRGTGSNVGITAFSLRAGQGFVRVVSSANGPQSVVLRLERDGRVLESTRLRVPGGGANAWVPQTKLLQAGTYRVAFDASWKDALAMDDQAVAAVLTGRVVVAPAQDDVQKASASVPGVRVVAQSTPPLSARGSAALVLVGAVPKRLLAGHYLIFAPLANDSASKLVRVNSWDQSSDALRFVELSGVLLRPHTAPPPEIPGGSWRVLARAGGQPVVFAGSGPGVSAVYVAAHPLDSNWRSLPAFPVFVFNVLSGFLNAQTLPLGTRLEGGARQLEVGVVKTPDGTQVFNVLSDVVSGLPQGSLNDQDIKTVGLQPNAPTRANTQESDTQAGSDTGWALWLAALAFLALLGEALVRVVPVLRPSILGSPVFGSRRKT